MFVYTVTATKRKWKLLKDNFNRSVRKNLNADFKNHRLSFLLKNESIDATKKPVTDTGNEKSMEQDLNLFFRGIMNTMCKFPRLRVARMKHEISDLIGRAEIELYEEDNDRELFSIDPLTEITYITTADTPSNE